MTPLQQELARRLQRAAKDSGSRRVVYRTEYLVYLPFGQYHWVIVAGEDESLACPDCWERHDLEMLADAGLLVRISHWVNPQDDCERESHYDIAANQDAEPHTAPGGDEVT
jgi:hypothetical protein